MHQNEDRSARNTIALVRVALGDFCLSGSVGTRMLSGVSAPHRVGPGSSALEWLLRSWPLPVSSNGHLKWRASLKLALRYLGLCTHLFQVCSRLETMSSGDHQTQTEVLPGCSNIQRMCLGLKWPMQGQTDILQAALLLMLL